MKPKLALATFAMASLFCAVSAQASIVTYSTNLSGAAESPVNASTGTGRATVVIDDVLNTMRVIVNFANLTSTTTNAHIHCCTATALTGTAGVATVSPTFTGFPAGVTAGSYDFTYNLLAVTGTWNPAFVTANGGTPASAEAVFLAGLASGKTYLNIHTSAFGGGEIRGFLVPEPMSAALVLLGLGGLVLTGRRSAK